MSSKITHFERKSRCSTLLTNRFHTCIMCVSHKTRTTKHEYTQEAHRNSKRAIGTHAYVDQANVKVKMDESNRITPMNRTGECYGSAQVNVA